MIININGINESFKKDNIRKTSVTNFKNKKKTYPIPLIQFQCVLPRAIKAFRCFCCAVATLLRLGRKVVWVSVSQPPDRGPVPGPGTIIPGRDSPGIDN